MRSSLPRERVDKEDVEMNLRVVLETDVVDPKTLCVDPGLEKAVDFRNELEDRR